MVFVFNECKWNHIQCSSCWEIAQEVQGQEMGMPQWLKWEHGMELTTNLNTEFTWDSAMPLAKSGCRLLLNKAFSHTKIKPCSAICKRSGNKLWNLSVLQHLGLLILQEHPARKLHSFLWSTKIPVLTSEKVMTAPETSSSACVTKELCTLSVITFCLNHFMKWATGSLQTKLCYLLPLH